MQHSSDTDAGTCPRHGRSASIADCSSAQSIVCLPAVDSHADLSERPRGVPGASLRRGSSPDGVVTFGQRQVEVPRRRRPIASWHDDARRLSPFFGFSAVGSRRHVALRRELGGDAGVVLERRVVGQHAPDVVAVAPRVVPHSQSLAARAVRVFPRRVSKAVEHVRLDEEGIVARDVCRVAVAVRVAQRLHASRVLRRVQVLLPTRARTPVRGVVCGNPGPGGCAGGCTRRGDRRAGTWRARASRASRRRRGRSGG